MTNPEATESQCSLETQIEVQQWSALLARSIPLIYGMYMRKGIHPALAEELTQNSVFDAVRGRGTYDPERGSLEQWLVGIARKNLAQEMRQRALRDRVQGDLSVYLRTLETTPLPDRVLEEKEAAQRVHAALAGLPVHERRVLQLKYLQDRSARTIAQEMGLTEKAVHSLLYRARKALRDLLRTVSPKEEPYL